MKKVAVIGTGVIGNGWITRFLANGCEVVAYDPAHGAKERTMQTIENAWESVEQLGLKEGASRDSLTFVDSIEEAVKDAHLIQESVPERYELKHGVLKEIDRFAHSNTIIGSSTSGIKPTDLQIDLNHPERLIVAHPFNPVYLLPLVEIVGGEATTKEIKDKALAYYESLQMKPMVIEKEIEGFVADRLMEALWREALHLVNDGIATTEEVDKAVTYGAGLRWAQMGPFMTFHLAGGNEGMRHMLEQFGPALKLPWTKLEAPELTDELKERVIQGCETHANDRSVKELERRRNEFLVKLIDLVEDYWP
ncbi:MULTISPECIES: 3-hydroxyacyl-CoA dehydrogenase NAD-binding domain-containing protein [Oceanobacillus]|uniref:L-carnitine dehydrogenase n=1 Tax=Oceanobacillus kimchii TaxID=746691 RepID=A0ABQ5TH17_9BACI|nr:MULTISPECIES: 3-hydroxyacyl-CoA dehydrogenase NAD-binding domain-containing protein [Oceanobacillus]MBT2599292.1 L-carnitine dehydrogenase [Oceanobacillus sp. ISL-74]MBT2652210.1 L-carnitine dehydrogenase [Oceanobacillus sp. ISL-73]MCT1578508.1 3-hydroxyacyl-CoA dehydrogenase NAD-binding domain-containing protein [Oceanobacillus kimchii]MCT2136443.1 3-hydroxyacyl-CoA dehydrogenase NAD-binding domain-containing protein [Oceanobacillus kimchii]GLO65447.1 L-carnitine dehydrogenase [Oceanobacil